MLKHLIAGVLLWTLSSFQLSFSQSSAASVAYFSKDNIPAVLRGNFEDDYGIRYSINDSLWIQHPYAKYHIISVDTTNQYLIVQNDQQNKTEGGLFARIDYMKFTKMKPFLWGFCLTIYDAKTPEEAKAAISADRANPKSGCGGFPFSRMKRMNELN